MSRLRTMSKHFYNDEIEYVLPNGDIYLKQGVKRREYSTADYETNGTEHINFPALYKDSWEKKVRSYTDIDEKGTELDNWE